MRLTDRAGGAAPIDAARFAAAMHAFGPFEAKPLIAVGVSGGPDSMALVLLMDKWARDRGGAVLALTVDHGLRPEAAAEAAQVAHWLGARGVAHQTLVWTGDKPASGLQEAAREARYGLLDDACRSRGILHLALAHHADDQAETVAFRRKRGSGGAGLAGIPAVRTLGAVRLVRPLLAFPKAALVATCGALGQAHIEDPSNRAERYARTAIRRRLAAAPAEREALLAEARSAATVRASEERALAHVLARIAEVRPDGSLYLDARGLTDCPPAQGRAILAAVLRTVGGATYAPGEPAVARLWTACRAAPFRGASLGGCLVRPRGERLLVCREWRRIGAPLALPAGEWMVWDGRFRVRCDERGFSIAPLGSADYAGLRRALGTPRPAIVAASLPAIRSGSELVAVPGLAWSKSGAPAIFQEFLPLWPLAPEMFTVVCAGGSIICDTVGGEPFMKRRS